MNIFESKQEILSARYKGFIQVVNVSSSLIPLTEDGIYLSPDMYAVLPWSEKIQKGLDSFLLIKLDFETEDLSDSKSTKKMRKNAVVIDDSTILMGETEPVDEENSSAIEELVIENSPQIEELVENIKEDAEVATEIQAD